MVLTTTKKGQAFCRICSTEEIGEYRHISYLYPFGSEGITACHDCCMEITRFVRELAAKKFSKRWKQLCESKRL